MKKSAKAVSIIGGADGPTSIFIVGRHKEKNFFRRIKSAYINRKYKRKRALAAKSIHPNPHTIEEVILYIRQQYSAFEADDSYYCYKERKRGMKMALIQREKPELLGGEKHFDPPSDFQNMEAVNKWQRELDDYIHDCERKTELISNEVFPVDYHLFLINKEAQGTLEVEIETLRSLLSISWSGDKKIMEPISKDIYLYYGVSQRDIDEKTERYLGLLACLSS